MSVKPAAIPLFADAYLADTMHLSTEEHGAYLLLLMAAWRFDDCSLPDDDKKLAKVARLSLHRWRKMAPTIREFWTVEGDRIYNSRLRRERDYVEKISSKNRENVARRWANQAIEKQQSGPYQRIYQTDTPPPPPIEEPIGSSPPCSPPKPTRANSKGSRLPDGWEPVLTPRAQAIVDAWPCGMLERELTKFRNHAADKGRLSKDWQAAFRTWIDNADEWKTRDADRHSPSHRQHPARDRRDGLERACDDTIAGAGR